MDEFGFELALCAHLEEATDWVLARQLGAGVRSPGGRVVDVCGVIPGPDFDARTAISATELPWRALESGVGTGVARYWKRAFDCHPDLARSTVAAAVEAGFFERERRGGRDYVRQAVRYPDDWFASLVGIENKPDLGTPGALETQLRTDVSLALFDEVILATESYVTRAHLNRIPPEVGVWRFDPDAGERTVVRDPTPLRTDHPGIEIVGHTPLRTDVAVVSAEEKARKRRRLAERAYGKGWRTYLADLPACARLSPTADGRPHCAYHGRVVDPAVACGEACPGFEAGERSGVDAAALRAARTPWVADPGGVKRRQSGLDQFR